MYHWHINYINAYHVESLPPTLQQLSLVELLAGQLWPDRPNMEVNREQICCLLVLNNLDSVSYMDEITQQTQCLHSATTLVWWFDCLYPANQFTSICFTAFKLRMDISGCASRPQSTIENTTARDSRDIIFPGLQEDWRIFAPAFFNKVVCKTHLSHGNRKPKQARLQQGDLRRWMNPGRHWTRMAPALKYGCAVQIVSNAQRLGSQVHSLPNFFLGWPDLPQVQQALFPDSSSISTMQCGGCSLSDRNKVYRTSIFYFLPHLLPLFYPIQSASTPPGARYFLGSLRKRRSSWSCLGAAPAMVTSYATCLLSGWNQQNWHVCVCMYVCTYV